MLFIEKRWKFEKKINIDMLDRTDTKKNSWKQPKKIYDEFEKHRKIQFIRI